MSRPDERQVVRAALALARRAGARDASEQQHQRGKERLLTALAARQLLPAPRRWPLVAALAAAAVVVLLLAVPRLFPDAERAPTAALRYEVTGASLEGGYLAPAANARAALRFEEGSELTLAGGGRARLADVSAHGARLSLERGSVHVRVTHRPGADWTIDAGPYAVHVTGTAFDVSWDPDAQALGLAMEEGSVEVRGPLAEQGVAVSAGGRLYARPAAGELRLERPDAARDPAASSASAAPEASRARLTPIASASARAPTWAELVGKGEHDAVIAQAEARGLGASLAQAPLGDLVALADAARYAGRSDIAEQALKAQRDRFPDTAAARSAAFLLGRMAESSPARAIAYYDQYLAEGGGPFSAEALGRKMMAQQRAGDAAGARASAQHYLARHPEGAHAAAARALTAPPAASATP